MQKSLMRVHEGFVLTFVEETRDGHVIVTAGPERKTLTQAIWSELPSHEGEASQEFNKPPSTAEDPKEE